ncbi:MAG: dihydrodipicolinate synthase family protein [Planctomycetaceae bacterium]|nr:dihydrodipicolinate synthase family protein [Planctomycetaceae bacterium]
MPRSVPPSRFHGMMPILPTAIDSSGIIDEASQRRLVQYCLQYGAAAIGHFGIASEFHKIGDRDRRRLTEIIVDEVAGRVPVFLGVTALGTGTAVELAQLAEEQGADLIMAALPYMNVPDAAGAFAYYRALSEGTRLPIIVQDTPASSSVLTADLLVRMFADIDGVLHVKGEGRDFLTKTAHLLAAADGQISVIGGAGGRHLIHMLRLGVTAFMTGTEALDLHGGAVDAYLNGDEEGAAKIYFERILPYLMSYLDYSEELLKEMLHRRGIISHPAVLDPPAMAPMSDVERREFDWVLERIGLGPV